MNYLKKFNEESSHLDKYYHQISENEFGNSIWGSNNTDPHRSEKDISKFANENWDIFSKSEKEKINEALEKKYPYAGWFNYNAPYDVKKSKEKAINIATKEGNRKILEIFKLKDEYFYINYLKYEIPNIDSYRNPKLAKMRMIVSPNSPTCKIFNYKCDQIDGVVKFIENEVTLFKA